MQRRGFAAGVAFFRMEGDTARGERIRGVAEETSDRFPGLRISLASAAALRGAVESRDPVTAIATAAEMSPELLELAGHSADERVTIFPVLVRDDVRALIYSWGACNLPPWSCCARSRRRYGPGIEPVTVDRAGCPNWCRSRAAEPRPRPTWDSLPVEEQQVHFKAQRFARVQAAEMRLHQAQAVQAGRTRRDLYGALRETDRRARARSFGNSFSRACPSMVDYLHLELVRTLANDDAEALGKDYPGPLL